MRYTASLHLVDFKCASNFGEAQAERIGLGFDLPTQSTVVAPNAPKEVDQTSVGSVA
jgi:hypothetical protein